MQGLTTLATSGILKLAARHGGFQANVLEHGVYRNRGRGEAISSGHSCAREWETQLRQRN